MDSNSSINNNNAKTFKYKNTLYIPGILMDSSSSYREFFSPVHRVNPQNNIKHSNQLTRNLKGISVNQSLSKNFSLPDILQTPLHHFKLVYQKEQLRKGQNQLILEQLKKKYSDNHLNKLKILNHKCHYLCNSGNHLYLLSPENSTKKHSKSKNCSFQNKINLNNSIINNNISRKGNDSFHKGSSTKHNKSLIESKPKTISEMQLESKKKIKLKTSQDLFLQKIIKQKESLNTSCDSDKLDYDNEVFSQLNKDDESKIVINNNNINNSVNCQTKQEKQKLFMNYDLNLLQKKFRLLSGNIKDYSSSKDEDIKPPISVLHFKGFEKRMMKI